MVKKELTPSDWWAQNIWRTQSGGKEKIFALVRRKYGESDVETKGPGQYLGLKESDRFEMVTDNDADSETFGKRVPNPSGEPVGKKLEYTLEFNDKNIKDLRQMVAVIGTPFGQTRFYYKFKERTITCESEEEFWTLDWHEAHERYIHRKQVIQIEQANKHDNTPKRTK